MTNVQGERENCPQDRKREDVCGLQSREIHPWSLAKPRAVTRTMAPLRKVDQGLHGFQLQYETLHGMREEKLGL